ncbi:isoaspartyl peptidase/L-asparaginase isoform X2 [Chrysoperla carnea]|nr:isoaspartyl peptidase/L-asparaginase isoform X2 [Chrysoperla carnea]XP_044730187.1 isoaspartyl peptidase/L-asparaginase isoform X2 [Chrysoperla carnea]
MIEPVVLVHGGAGNIPTTRVQEKIDGVTKAAKIGYKRLLSGGSVIDAVEAAVNFMEDDIAFNAGYGSIVNLDGQVEMDASIMDGKNLQSGCLGALKDIKNPISLARLVMEKTPHCLLVGEGATKFAKSQNVPILPPGTLVTPVALEALEKWKKKGGIANTEIGPDQNPGSVGTVGAVAVDRYGHVAVATSTGGINGKMVGRVGDTAIIGAGSYADDNIGAVSTTGHGDTIIKYCLAHAIIKSMEKGLSAQDSTTKNIDTMTERLKNTAGAITISNKGEVGIGFSSARMAWAYQKKNELHYGIEHDQHCKELIEEEC